jgi:precorrin-2 dehydrogenase/sirohydrochlorin ferrochelatase
MHPYPIFLDLEDRHCLVVGGGGVGTRKAQGLLACGARVTVVSPRMDPALEALLPHERLCLERRAYRPEDMAGVFLAFSATDDSALNRRIQRDAADRKTLCNVADRPELCDFILPAVVRRGALLLAITTSGKSPALAKRLRRQLEAQFGPEYENLIRLLGALRNRLLAQGHDPAGHRKAFNTLLEGDLLGLVRRESTAEIDALLAKTLGPGYRFERLMADAEAARPTGEEAPSTATDQA